MCGICGKVALDSNTVVEPAVVKQMMRTIAHRGPDDDGIYVNPQAVLGHRRLAIIDLSTGKQPISNEDDTLWIVFNGEIYNFKELRAGLISKGHTFRTHSDTEVILHLYEEHGPDCVSKLYGMFAFALWDDKTKALLLARDRVGIKPLYYAVAGGHLLFGSEIKALLADPSVTREVNAPTIDNFLTHLYCPGPETMLRGILKLEPGHYLMLRNGQITTRQYWDLRFDGPPNKASADTIARDLVALLKETVRGHMIADVPVGVLLSGGVDSTAMLSFAVEETQQDVKSFTIGFSGENFADERPFARLAAKRYGSQHFETSISAREFSDFLPQYIWHMEEPVCEPPAVALYYVTKLARQHVKVLISGEGGDEAFAGYQNYRNLMWLERAKKLGAPFRALAAKGFEQAGRTGALRRFEKYSHVMRMPLRSYYFSRTAGPFSALNQAKGSLYSQSFRRELESARPAEFVQGLFARVASESALNQMLYVDTKTWLPDDLLIKADKITMANSLELRVPLLDHRVLEFAAALPARLKVRGFETKHILKKALRDRVPEEILNRPKTGFPVPYESWMRNELRDFAQDVLTDRTSVARGYFDPAAVQSLLQRGSSGGENLAPELFSLLTLELWHRAFMDQEAVRAVAPRESSFSSA